MKEILNKIKLWLYTPLRLMRILLKCLHSFSTSALGEGDWIISATLSQIFLILKRIEGDTIKNVCRYSCKVTAILVRIYGNWNFMDRFLKNSQVLNFTKIRLMGAELFHVDGQTDRRTDGQTDSHDEANRPCIIL